MREPASQIHPQFIGSESGSPDPGKSTASQRSLQSLREEVENLNSIINRIEVIVVMIDKNGIVRFINDQGCKLLNCSRNEVLNKNWFDTFIPVQNKSIMEEYLNKLLEGNEEIQTYRENSVLTFLNEEKLIGWQNSVIRNEDGTVEFVVSTGQELTEKRREEKVQKIILEILETANTSISLIDYIKFIHKSLGELMSVENFYIALYDKEKQLITLPYFVDKIDNDVPPKRYGRGLTEYVLRTGKSALIDRKTDEELIAKGEVELLGSPTSIWLGIPLKIQEDVIGALVVQDYENENTYGEKEREILEVISYAISRAIERKRVEDERNELIKKLQELNDSKDKLFSLISHDLRSPFNSLLGFSEILTTEFDSLTHDEIQEYLRVIYDASKNLYSMTNNLLHFSRFQMGRFEFHPERLKLDRIIDHCLNLVKGNIVKKQLNLTVEVNYANDIFADEDMLISIIQNLLSNAIKFTPRGGDVTIRSRKLSPSNGPSYVQITVEDTGVGMTDEILSKIFKESIYSTPGTEKEYGTGLGLLLVKEFVEKNGGKISVRSKLKRGTIFIFTIPAAL